MMKKIYLQPTIHVVSIETSHLFCATLNGFSNTTVNEDDMLGRDDDMDESVWEE